MSNSDKTPSESQGDWEGFREIDRAIAKNRRAKYRWQKAWDDPWERRALIFAALVAAAFITYVIIYDGLI